MIYILTSVHRFIVSRFGVDFDKSVLLESCMCTIMCLLCMNYLSKIDHGSVCML